MNKKTKNHLRTVSIAATSAIPILGGPISVLLDEYLPSYIKDKRDDFLNKLNVELEEVEKMQGKIDLSSHKFISTFLKAGRIALEEIDEYKMSCVRNIILNSAVPDSKDFNEATLFLNWIRDFTIDQIRILKSVRDIDEVSYLNDSHLEKALVKVFPDVKIDYLTILARELGVKNIIKYQPSKSNNNKRWFLTDIGERFVSYIEFPKP